MATGAVNVICCRVSLVSPPAPPPSSSPCSLSTRPHKRSPPKQSAVMEVSAHSTMNMHINLSLRRRARTAHQKGEKKKKFSSNYTSKSAIITTLYIICIFQLLFKSCIGFCMQMYNIFRIRYITIKSISIQPLPCFPLISRVPR